MTFAVCGRAPADFSETPPMQSRQQKEGHNELLPFLPKQPVSSHVSM